MSTAQQDTEITLGTGRMLAIFFTFVLVCAFFFAIGFSLGRKTTLASASNWPSASTGAPSTVVRPSAAKNDAAQTTPQPTSSDFSFYKAVGEKTAEGGSAPPDTTTQASATQSAKTQPAVASTATPVNSGADVAPASGGYGSGYYVQVAAVSRKEDADALVEALKKKQYPAFSANNPSSDKFYHVQVGPYADAKDAEGMRTRLIGDGYNPIVKK
jgi:cell division septation protein DedD